jgi:hypothetical protein
MASDTHQFTYRVQEPAASTDCAGLATDLATRFQTASGLTGVTGTCEGVSPLIEGAQTYNVATMVVTYQNDVELSPTRAIFGGSEFLGDPSAESPLFDTYAACLAELQKQVPNFEAQTGAPFVDAHCDAADTALETGYSLTIETFGKTKQQLFAFIPDLGLGETDRSNSLILSSAAQSLSAAGAHVVYADEAHVFFYAQYDLPVLLSDLGSFDTPAECQEQIGDVDAIYSQSNIDSVISFCEPVGTSTSVTLESVGVGLDMTLETTSTDHYASYAECRADRARAVANEASSGRNVVGAICVPSSPVGPQGYELHIYTYER